MTPDVSYGYTDPDLLADPETYEYSEVHGRPFLDAYMMDRSWTIEYIDAHLVDDESDGSEEGWRGLLDTLVWAETNRAWPFLPNLEAHASSRLTHAEGDGIGLQAPGTSRIETVSLLATMLGYPGGRPGTDDCHSEWLDFLTKRFEVDKRLFAHYDEHGPPEAGDPAPLLAYGMLALGVLVAHERNPNLKYVNVALKLGDILSSKREELRSDGGLAIAKLAVEEERGAIEALAKSTGIEL